MPGKPQTRHRLVNISYLLSSLSQPMMWRTRCPGIQFRSSELNVPGLYLLPEAPSRNAAQYITARFSWIIFDWPSPCVPPHQMARGGHARPNRSPAGVPRIKKDPELTGTIEPSTGRLISIPGCAVHARVGQHDVAAPHLLPEKQREQPLVQAEHRRPLAGLEEAHARLGVAELEAAAAARGAAHRGVRLPAAVCAGGVWREVCFGSWR